MKSALSNVAITIAVLIVAVSLTSCGGSSKTWPVNDLKNFVYLVDTSTLNDAVSGPHSARVRQMAGYKRHSAKPQARKEASIATGTIDVYLWDVTAGTATKLNSTSADYDSVVLSYDYKTVYFTAWDSNGYAQIYSATVANFNSPTQLTSSSTEDHHDITISKDGTLIATCVVNNTINLTELATMPSSGGAETLIAPTGMEDSWLPRFTPDKSTIIFEADTNALQAGIYSIQIGSTTPTRLTNASGTYWDWDPSVSPDGTQISFVREHGAEEDLDDIYVVPITGETTAAPATAVTTDGYVYEQVHLGDYIAFTDYKNTINGSGNSQLFLTSISGTDMVQLTTADENVGFDLW